MQYFNFLYIILVKLSVKIICDKKEDFIKDKISRLFPNNENFNIFKYSSEIKNNTLLIYKLTDFALNNLIGKKVKSQIVEQNKLYNFLLILAQEYNSNTYPKMNSYHNLFHAAEVVQSLYIYLSKLKKNNSILFLDTYIKQEEELEMISNINYNDLDIFSLIISAACHDFRHPGRNNDFYLNYKDKVPFSKILKEYNYKLELYHYAESKKLIEKMNLLELLNDYQKKRFYKIMKIAIYGTDNSLNQKHAENLIKYKNIVNINANNLNNENISYIDDIKLIMFECFVHAADISNPTKETNYYITWSDKILEEFCEQSKEIHSYDEKKDINCAEKNDKKFRESNLPFIKNIIEVFFKPFCECFPYLNYLCENIKKNKKLLEGTEKIHK